MTNIENKIARLSQLWVKWNAKEVTGNDFAMAFRKEFHYETSQAWDEKLHKKRLANRIREEMAQEMPELQG